MSIEQLEDPADVMQWLEDRHITKLMYMIWLSRSDLQHAFDLNSADGQRAFCNWYDVSVFREYGLDPRSVLNASEKGVNEVTHSTSWKTPLHIRLMRLEGMIGRVGCCWPVRFRRYGKAIWFRLLAFAARMTARAHSRNREKKISVRSRSPSGGSAGTPGVTLVGYAHAQLGMGEHVRMSAAALESTDVKYGVLNFSVGVPTGRQAVMDQGKFVVSNIYRANLFHINADQMMKAYCHLGYEFFARRYNIGYWAWELAKCPEEWVPVLDMVDEVWAPSRFIQNAFSERTNKSVVYMPLCVSLPSFPRYNRAYFGLPSSTFLFLFIFDFLSYIDRKNPYAAIAAFKRAFREHRADVGLVIKVMNGDQKASKWLRMLNMIEDDPRIHVLNRTMDRGEVLGLFDVCDSFVSLHRSEGFGRGPAEAMYLGKPVIVTDYSGNTDFTLPDNSCPVNYQLIPVEEGQYVFGNGQVWADPDVDHAAWFMRKLVHDARYGEELGKRARQFVRTKFSPTAIGARYKERLRAIGVI